MNADLKLMDEGHDSLSIGGHTVGNRIVTDPAILGGKPVVRGTRISVEHILELIASGASVDDIARTYPALAREDVIAAVQFAAGYLRGSSWIELEIAS